MVLKKIVLLFLSVVYMFAINLQTASKSELMSIKGIGEKRAEAIMRYRRTHRIRKADDLLGVKGIGENIIENIKRGVKNKTKPTTTKAKKRRKTSSKKSKTQKRKFTREMANRIWSDSSFLEKELSKYDNIKVIYD